MALAITLSNGRTWRTKAAALSHFKAMLARHTDGAVVEDRNDHEDLVALLERYDEAITDGPSKTGMGIDHFTRTRNNFNEQGDEQGCVPREITGTHIGFEDVTATQRPCRFRYRGGGPDGCHTGLRTRVRIECHPPFC